MKVWLNKLKEGDTFYHIFGYDVYKCKHLGDANNLEFRMPRIKYQFLDGDNSVYEMFVNTYVYDDEETAREDLKKQMMKKLQELEMELRNAQLNVIIMENEINRIKSIIDEGEK